MSSPATDHLGKAVKSGRVQASPVPSRMGTSRHPGLLLDRPISPHEARQSRIADAEARRWELESRPRLDTVELHDCAVADLSKHVAAGSVDLVLTDPPYPREYLGTWADLARFSAHALKPGGLLVAMSGQLNLPEVMRLTAADTLEYRWLMSVYLPGAVYMSWPSRMQCGWKPVLVYRKSGGDKADVRYDVIHGEHRLTQDDRFHIWGQQEPVWNELALRFAYPGQTICDPFLGGGTTAIAARLRGCAFIGADNDPDAIQTTRDRLNASDT